MIRYSHSLIAIPFILAGFFFQSQNALAAKFTNQFIEFEMPPQWQCSLEGAEWVCQSTNDGKKRDAIIVLAAKLKGEQDSLDQYLAYLKAAKVFKNIQGKDMKSDPKYAKTVNLNGQAWVDALHLESELPGFYTRYLATIKADIGVLVTYSINKAKYQDYLNDFEAMVKTLKVFRQAGAPINAQPPNSDLFKTQIPQNVSDSTVFGGNIPTGSDQAPAKKKEDLPVLPLLLGAGAVGFFIWKRRRGMTE
jgi:hypothetical protein